MSGPIQARRGQWRRGRRAVVGGLLIVATGVLAVGCGSAGPTTTTSSGSKQGAAKDSGATAAFAYARCMRSHGVSDFPDPKIVTSPNSQAITFHLTHADAASPAFKGASQKCQSILPGPTNGPGAAAQRQAHKQGLLAFGQCMRSKGIAGFPDPNSQGDLNLQMVSAAGIDIHSREVLDAAKACAPASHGVVNIGDVERAINAAP